jgi:hypothetical protein
VSPLFCHSNKFNAKLLWLSRTADPLVHHGRHFGRSVHAMCNVRALITNGLVRMAESEGEVQEETLTFEFVLILSCLDFYLCTMLEHRARGEHRAFKKLLELVPRLTERLLEASDEESMMMADLVRLRANFNFLSHAL